jgi:RHS repeat-associated protein
VRAIDISGGTNRYKSVTGVEYDAAGQVTVDPKFRGREYQYDANGRQRWTARLDGTGVATALYDGAGQRVETTAGGETKQIIYDAFGQMIAEYKAGVWVRDYIYRGGQVVASVDAAGSTARYMMSDLQGSARVTMDASGGVIARHDYLPFGEEIQAGTGLRTTAQGYGAADERKQKYALLERDEETGQDHAWWRKYENLSGRWTSPDPYTGSMSIGDPQSLNRYAYVQNDPVNFVDPSGLEETLACYVDGIPVSCSFGLSLINSGAGYLNGTPGFYGGGNILLTYAGNLHVDGLSMGFQQAFFNDPQDLPGGGEQEPNIKKDKKRKQQQEFNNCAKRAWRRYRWKYLETSFVAVAGGAFLGVGIVMGKTSTGTAGLSGSGVGNLLGGGLAWEALKEADENQTKLHADVKDCASKFPDADHRFSFLTF